MASSFRQTSDDALLTSKPRTLDVRRSQSATDSRRPTGSPSARPACSWTAGCARSSWTGARSMPRRSTWRLSSRATTYLPRSRTRAQRVATAMASLTRRDRTTRRASRARHCLQPPHGALFGPIPVAQCALPCRASKRLPEAVRLHPRIRCRPSCPFRAEQSSRRWRSR